MKTSEGKYRVMVDTIPTLAWCSLPDWFDRVLQSTMARLYKPLPAAGTRLGMESHNSSGRPGEVNDKWRALLASGEPGEVEARLRRYDGGYRWFLFRSEPLRDERGDIARWYGTITDIENLKRTEEKLRQDESELRRITDAIPQTIIVQDPDGTPLYANRAVLDYTGRTIEDVTAPNFRERIFHPEDIRGCGRSARRPSYAV